MTEPGHKNCSVGLFARPPLRSDVLKRGSRTGARDRARDKEAWLASLVRHFTITMTYEKGATRYLDRINRTVKSSFIYNIPSILFKNKNMSPNDGTGFPSRKQGLIVKDTENAIDSTMAHHPTILIVDDQEWSSRSLESVFSGDEYRVILVHTAHDALAAAKAQLPDLLFINDALPNDDGVKLCHSLRADLEFGKVRPILIIASERPTRDRRLTALRAGAWEVISHPIDAEELLLRIRAYLEASFELDRLRKQCLVDYLTGLYNVRGLEQRAKEITSVARRESQAVACVVLAPIFEFDRDLAAESQGLISGAAARCGSALKSVGRISDAIGRLGPLEFAVLAPSTDKDGAVLLAERMAGALRTCLEAEKLTSFDLRAGFEAVANAGETTMAPSDLLVHATRALQKSRRMGNGDWIQQFTPG